MKLNTLKELEKFVDGILSGKQTSTTLPIQLQEKIRAILKEMHSLQPEKNFRKKLLHTLQTRIAHMQSAGKNTHIHSFWDRMKEGISFYKREIGIGLMGTFGVFILTTVIFVDPQQEWHQTLPDEAEKSTLLSDDTADLKATQREWPTGELEKVSPPQFEGGGLMNSRDHPENAVTSSSMLAPSELGMSADDAYKTGEMFAPPSAAGIAPRISYEPLPEYDTGERYKTFAENSFQDVFSAPVSTFSVDTDTGGYANIRRFLNADQFPPRDAVRVEEMINYFSYDYAPPRTQQTPFAVYTQVAPSPWNEETKLLHIGLKGYENIAEEMPASNLVFLVDVSGSMSSANKLPLLQDSLQLLIQSLREQDRLSLVTYAGHSSVVVSGISGAQKGEAEEILSSLTAGGSTAGAAGITLAYEQAEKHFIKGGINRIFLATDGDFNVGVTNFDDLLEMVAEKRKNGVALSALGFGTGNYNEHLMEQLADAGNGNYSYIDTLKEAQKVLVQERRSTLQTIAKDVKVQIEFNPQFVHQYRLIGYENRALKREDFDNDAIDAGEIGMGHSVTALYEIILTDDHTDSSDQLRYQTEVTRAENYDLKQGELAFVKLRFKRPESDGSELRTFPVFAHDMISFWENASANFRWAATVAAFGQKLRNSKYVENTSWQQIQNWAEAAIGSDEYGFRAEMIKLIKKAERLPR